MDLLSIHTLSTLAAHGGAHSPGLLRGGLVRSEDIEGPPEAHVHSALVEMSGIV